MCPLERVVSSSGAPMIKAAREGPVSVAWPRQSSCEHAISSGGLSLPASRMSIDTEANGLTQPPSFSGKAR